MLLPFHASHIDYYDLGTRNAADWWLAHWVRLSCSVSVTSSCYLENVTTTHLGPLTLSNLIRSTNSEQTASITLPATQLSSSSRSFYLTVYGSIVGGNVLATTFRAVLFAFGGLAASAIVHENALDTVLHVSGPIVRSPCCLYLFLRPQFSVIGNLVSMTTVIHASNNLMLSLFLSKPLVRVTLSVLCSSVINENV